jgi:hypothetical protein
MLVGLMICVANPSDAGATGTSDPETTDPWTACSREAAIEAEDTLSQLSIRAMKETDRNHWPELKSWWLKYYACDDGSIGEGFSEATIQLLRREWSEGQKALLRDASLRSAALRHIDATLGDSDVRVVRQQALSRCNRGKAERELCREIVSACDAALQGMSG